jgi:hypothetical protein
LPEEEGEEEVELINDTDTWVARVVEVEVV